MSFLCQKYNLLLFCELVLFQLLACFCKERCSMKYSV